MPIDLNYYIETLKQSNNSTIFDSFLMGMPTDCLHYCTITDLDGNSRQKYPLVNNICVCTQFSDKTIREYHYNSKQNDIIYTDFTTRSRRKFYDTISKFDYIISDFSIDNPNNQAILLRKEVLDNYIFDNYNYYLDSDYCFNQSLHEIYLTEKLFNMITNSEYFEQWKFDSLLLNHFLKGLTVDDIVIKPNINISRYGRWYWSNTDKFQTNIAERNRVYSKLSKYGIVINIDLVSGEPMILSKLAHSKLLKKFIDYRMSLKDKDDEMRNILKKFINIFIHSYPTVNSVYNTVVKTISNYGRIEDIIGIPLEKIIEKLFNEFSDYNDKVIQSYRNTLEYKELQRRIIIPCAPIMSNADIIKEHRKYMQGHTHDLVLKYAFMNYQTCNILPIFTIHDCLSYFIQDVTNIDDIIDNIKKNAKKLKVSINLEIRKRKGVNYGK